MRDVEAAPVCSRPERTRSDSPTRALTFGGDPAFQQALRQRVAAYFATTGRRQRDCWQMYVKTAILLVCFAALYVLLVFVARTWWQALPLAVLLGLVAAGIGFNVQHDGGHQALFGLTPGSTSSWRMTLDLIGGSSYFWHYKHGVFHHTYTNITGHDTDIDLGILGRLAPAPEAAGVPPLAALLPLAALRACWRSSGTSMTISATSSAGAIGEHRVPRPRGWDLVIFLAGKAVFFSLAFGMPMLFHSVWAVLLFYAVAGVVLGIVLSVVFQLAHCVEEAEFPQPRPRHRAHRKRLGHPSGRDHGGLRPPQPGGVLAAGRPELPDRAPPVPPDLPRQLPGHLEAGGGDLPGMGGAVLGAPLLLGGGRVALPLAAAHGDAGPDRSAGGRWPPIQARARGPPIT